MTFKHSRLTFPVIRLILCLVFFQMLPPIVTGQQLEGIASQKPFAIHGNLGFDLIGYHVSGIDARMNPFTMMLSAQATAQVYGIAIPFSFRYSGKKAEYAQPFNQFGLSPQYKWLTLHGGYRNVNFSNFTLAGHTFLGGGVEMNPGKFRFGFVYGRFRDQSDEFGYGMDTLSKFSRKGMALRLGVGNTQNFADFIFLRIQDDSTSLPDGSTFPPSPAEQNVVVGINSRVALGKRFTLEAEAAGSLYTTDLAAQGLENVEELPSFLRSGKFMALNISSELLSAIRTSLHYKGKQFTTRLEYRRIDPNYRSMGAYFFNNDIEQVTLAPSLSVFKRKLSLRGSIGVQRDNLRETKKATTVRAISSLSASFNPVPAFGLDMNFSNYSNNQRPGTLPLIDSLRQYHTTANFSVSPRLMILKPKYQHLIFLMISRMELNDKNSSTALYTENRAVILNLNYHLNLVDQSLTLMAGLHHNRLENSSALHRATGVSAGIAKTMFDSKLQAGWNNSLIRNHTGQKGWTINSSVNTTYLLNKHHSFRFSLYFIRAYYEDETLTPSFNEIKGDFGYVYSF